MTATARTYGFRFACPECGQKLTAIGDAWRCDTDLTEYRSVRGVWRFLTQAQSDRLAPFLEDYRRIRHAEGRGSDGSEHYRDLPFIDAAHALSSAWSIRAASYRALIRRVLRDEQVRARRKLRILDLGAGNGWLSNRLTQLGHRSAAVDVFSDAVDGLEALRHYEQPFLCAEASFDSLPFESNSVDVAIFNASLHYAPDVEVPLREALRVLRPNGRLVILDTPIYRRAESGARMVAEREANFLAEYGTRSNALNSEDFLTMNRLAELSARMGVAWRLLTPNYGVRWFLEPWRARIKGLREPARFRIVTAVAPGRGHDGLPTAVAATHESDVSPAETSR